MIDQEHNKLSWLEAQAMAVINDELMKKVQSYELSLATERSLCNAAEVQAQCFIKDNQDL